MPFNDDARPVSVEDPDGEIYAELVELPGTTRLLPGLLEFLEDEGKLPIEREDDRNV